MGCTSSVQIARYSQGNLKLDQDIETFCCDELLLEEVTYLKDMLLQVHIALGLFRKDKHDKFELVKAEPQILKKLYQLCNQNQQETKYIFHLLLLRQLPSKSQSLAKQNAQIQTQSKLTALPYKYIQNLSSFIKIGSDQSFVSFGHFIKMYAIFLNIPTQSEAYPKVLFSFLTKGVPFLYISDFKQFLSSLNIKIEEFQKLFKQQENQIQSFSKKTGRQAQNSSIFMLPTMIEEQNFTKYMRALQKSQQFSKKLAQFQQNFSLLKNFKSIFRDYFEMEQLLIDEEITSIKSYGEKVFVVSKRWYDSFVILFHKVYDSKVLRTDRKQLKGNFIRLSKNKAPQKDRKSYNSTQKNIQVAQINQYVLLKNQKIDTSQIQGEFQLELKQGSSSFKVLSEKLYHFIESFLQKGKVSLELDPKHKNRQKQNKVQYPRIVLSSQKIQFYPVLIFLLQTNKKGKIDEQNVRQVLVSQSMTLRQLKTQYFQSKQQENGSFFVKLFDEKNFREQVNHSAKIKDLTSRNTKSIIAFTSNRVGFIELNTRKQITKDNLIVGDKIYAFSEKYDFTLSGYVISKDTDKGEVGIHFVGKSWRDEVNAKVKSVFLAKEQIQDQKQRPNDYVQMYQGLANVGNTCYINSSIQSLLSTSIFSTLLNHQPISKRLFSYQIQTVFQHLMFSPSQLIAKSVPGSKNSTQTEFKNQLQEFFKQFTLWEQQDTQEFIHAVLDKVSEEQKHFIENIFRFWIENQLVCSSKTCNGKKVNKEAMTMVTLPIPQPKQIYIQILLVPIYRQKLQKILIKLHHSTTLGELLRKFQERSGMDSSRFVMVEIENGVLKNVRTDMTEGMKDPDSVMLEQLGIVANFTFAAYEMIKEQKLIDLVKRNHREIKANDKKKQYHDFFIKQTKTWTIARISKPNLNPVTVEYLNKDKEIVEMKIPQAEIDNKSYQIESLGVKTLQSQKVHIRLFMRKLALSPVSQGKVFQPFGFPFIISLPIWCNYTDALSIIYEQLQNVITNAENNEDYTIRFSEIKKQKCIFCQTDLSKVYLPNDECLKRCCKVLETDAPILFLSQIKSFVIYLDWKNLKCYNSRFSSDLVMDRACKATEDEFKEQKVSLYECFNLLRIKEEVQMNCEKCKNPKMYRQESISTLPPILIIQLKEYRFLHGKQTMVKLNTNLKYEEVKKIDIEPYLDPNSILRESSNFSSIYELYSVIQHVGGGNSGHYTTICKRKSTNNSDEEVWVFFDDKFSQIINENEVQNYMNNAYMLFYRKQYLNVDARLKLKLI